MTRFAMAMETSMHLILTMMETLKGVDGSREIEILTRDEACCE